MNSVNSTSAHTNSSVTSSSLSNLSPSNLSDSNSTNAFFASAFKEKSKRGVSMMGGLRVESPTLIDNIPPLRALFKRKEESVKILDFAIGEPSHVIVINSEKEVICWGENFKNSLGTEKKVSFSHLFKKKEILSVYASFASGACILSPS